ncbi:MAG: hypothetical protein AAF662_10400 [Pseudomonadota bacterium]
MARSKLLLAVGFVCVYSSTPLCVALTLQHHATNKLWYSSLVFAGAACSSLVLALMHHDRSQAPSARNWHRLVGIGVAGVIGASYFGVIFGAGPASADWLEHALFPVFMLLALWLIALLKTRGDRRKTDSQIANFLSVPKALGYFLALIGFGVIVYSFPHKRLTSDAPMWVYMGILPILGAIGSAFSIVLIADAVRAGLGRFYCVAARYALVAVVVLSTAIWTDAGMQLSGFAIVSALFVGVVLINATLLIALKIVDDSSNMGPWSLSMLQLLVPVATTFGSLLTNSRDAIFQIPIVTLAVALCSITLGYALSEIYPNISEADEKTAAQSAVE